MTAASRPRQIERTPAERERQGICLELVDLQVRAVRAKFPKTAKILSDAIIAVGWEIYEQKQEQRCKQDT